MRHSTKGFILPMLLIAICILAFVAVSAVRFSHLSAEEIAQEITYTRAKLKAQSALTIAKQLLIEAPQRCTNRSFDRINAELSSDDIVVAVHCEMIDYPSDIAHASSLPMMKIIATAMHGKPSDPDYVVFTLDTLM